MYNNLTELTIRFAVHHKDFNEDFLMENYDKLNSKLYDSAYGSISSNHPMDEILKQEKIEWFLEGKRSKTLTTFLELKKIENKDHEYGKCVDVEFTKRKHYERDKYND